MDKAYLKALCEYAERKGFQRLSAETVIGLFKNRKSYMAPAIKLKQVKYPKMPMSWVAMDDMLKMLISRKEAIEKILKGLGVDIEEIVIGGSLSLKYQLPEFRDRAFGDVDFIISVSNENEIKKLRSVYSTLYQAGVGYFCNTYHEKNPSFMLGEFYWAGEKHPINLVLADMPIRPFRSTHVFNSPYEVFEAKRKYIKDSKKRSVCIRWKDYIDIYKGYKDGYSIELPW